MRIALLLFLSILCSSKGRAQDRFFTFVEGWVNSAAIEYENEYRLIGLEVLGFGDQHGLIINSIDEQGSNVFQMHFSIDTAYSTSMREMSSAAIMLNDSTVLIAGLIAYYTFENGIDGAIYHYNPLNQSIELMNSYNTARFSPFFGIEEHSDSTFLVICRETEVGGSDNSRIYNINVDGTIEWSSPLFSWGSQYQNTRPVEVVTLATGHIAALFWEIDLDQPTFHDRWRTRLSLMDENGQILWTRYPGDHENYRIRPGGITEQDGDILVAFSDPYYYDETGEWQGNPDDYIRFENYDTLGILQAEDSLIEDPINLPAVRNVTQILSTTDGNFIVAGYHTNKHGYLAKITPDYETIWYERYLPYEYGEETGIEYQELQILNVIETSDGGYLCTGTYFSDPGSIVFPNGIQTAIALKVDEFGCLVENCQVGLEEFALGALKLYPNPATDLLRVDSPSGAGGARWQSLQIIDLQGRVVKEIPTRNLSMPPSTLEIDVARLPAGLYTLMLRSDEQGIYTGKFLKE